MHENLTHAFRSSNQTLGSVLRDDDFGTSAGCLRTCILNKMLPSFSPHLFPIVILIHSWRILLY